LSDKLAQKSLFITFEGIDGCGKSTQARLLAEYLEKSGRSVVLTREPGGTPLAEEIRDVILTPGREELAPETEILLYAASRAQHVAQLIRPALAAGKIVVCERFTDSSLAYQGYGLGYDIELVRRVNQAATGDLEPDLTILLETEAAESLQRVTNRAGRNGNGVDRIEQRGLEFQERVRHGFLELAAAAPRIKVIPTTAKSIALIHQEALALVARELEGLK
jgi:dTMP kinase